MFFITKLFIYIKEIEGNRLGLKGYSEWNYKNVILSSFKSRLNIDVGMTSKYKHNLQNNVTRIWK